MAETTERIELTADQGYQPITVGQLRAAIADVPDELQVRTDWYDVTGVALFVLADGTRLLNLDNTE